MKNSFYTNKGRKIAIVSTLIIILILLFLLTPLKDIFKSSSLYSGKAGVLLKEAEEYYNKKEFDNALTKLDLAENSNPTNEQLAAIKKLREKINKERNELPEENEVQRLIRRAKESAVDNDFDSALEYLDKAEKINESSANPDIEARTQIKKLREEYLKRQKELALRDDPDDLLNRARILVREGDIDSALKLIKRARRAYDSQGMNDNKLNNRINDAEKIYSQRLKDQIKKDNPEDLILESRREAGNKNYSRAFKLLERARRSNNLKNPPDIDIENQIARLLKLFNQRQRMDDLNSNPQELVRMAKEQAQRDEYENALKLLKQAKRINNERANPDQKLNKEINELENEYQKRLLELTKGENPAKLINEARRMAIYGDKNLALKLLERANKSNASSKNPDNRITDEIEKLRNNYSKQQAEEAMVSKPESLMKDAQNYGDIEDYDSAIYFLNKANISNNIKDRPNRDIEKKILTQIDDYKNKIEKQKNQENSEDLTEKANIAFKNKDFLTALRYLERAKRSNEARKTPLNSVRNKINKLYNEYENEFIKKAKRDNPDNLVSNAKKLAEDKQYDKALKILKNARSSNNARTYPDVKKSKEIAELAQKFRSERDGDTKIITITTPERTQVITDTWQREGKISREELNKILEQERRKIEESMREQEKRERARSEEEKNKINELLREGENALRQRDYDRAINAFSEALKIDQNNARANSGIAQAYLGKKDHQRALQHATRAITINPNDADGHLVRGEVFYQNRQDEQAQASFETAVKLKPNLALAYYRLGVIYLIQNLNAKAKDAFIKSTKSYDFTELSITDRAKCYYNLGKANERLKLYDEAIKSYNTTLTLDQANHGSYISIGQILYIQRNYNGAISNLKRSIEIKNTYHAHFWLGKCYDELRNFNEAIKEYKAALELQADNYEALFNLGRAYALNNQHDIAIEQYKKAAEKHGINSKLLVQIGNSLLAKKDFEKAVETYKQALEKNANDVDAYIGLGRSYEEKGDMLQAVVFLKEGAGLTKDHTIYAKLGELYFKLKDYEQSISAFKNALSIQPNNINYRRFIADVYFEKKDFKNAANEYERVISLNPNEWVSYHRLGDSYIELKMLEAAKIIYKKLIERNPAYEKIDLIRQKVNQLEGGS